MGWGQLLEVGSKILTALAIVFGGGWVLFNYFAGRTHRPRLQLRVSGERVLRDGLEYLLVKTELSNVGLARVQLVKEGCTTTVYAHELPNLTTFVMEPQWVRLAAFELFRNQEFIEPSGLLIDQQLIAAPSLGGRFLKAWAHVESRNVAWNGETVIAPLAE
jgi:hypothetical protein